MVLAVAFLCLLSVAGAQTPAATATIPEPAAAAASAVAENSTVGSETAGTQAILFQVAATSSGVYDRFELRLDRLGASETLYLSDDGSLGDTPGDGVFAAVSTGPYARTVGVEIFAWQSNGARQLVYASIVRTNDINYSVISWQIGSRPDGRAERIATDWPGDSTVNADGLKVFVVLGWLAITLAYAGFAAGRRRA